MLDEIVYFSAPFFVNVLLYFSWSGENTSQCIGLVNAPIHYAKNMFLTRKFGSKYKMPKTFKKNF